MAGHHRVVVAITLAWVFTWTGVSATLCSEDRVINLYDGYSIATSNYPNSWSTEEHCYCTARIDSNSIYRSVGIKQNFWFQIDETDANNGELRNNTCKTEIQMEYGSVNVFACPTTKADTNVSTHTFELEGDREITWKLNNPRQGRFMVRLDLEVTYGTANVYLQCYRESLEGSDSKCLCGAGSEVVIYSLRSDEDFDKRFTVATVAVVIFISIIMSMVVIRWCLKLQREKEEKYFSDECPPMGNVGSENPGYNKSRSNLALNSPPTNGSGPGGPPNYTGFADLGQLTSFMGEPGMDLSLQTPHKHQGSTDSGLYSMPEKYQTDTLESNTPMRQNGAPGGPPQQPEPQRPGPYETPLDPHSLYAQPQKYRPSPQQPAQLPGRPPNHVYKTPSQGSLHDNPAFNLHDTSKGSINTLGSVETDV